MKRINIVAIAASKCTKKNYLINFFRDQQGFNLLGFLAFVAIVVVIALLVIPNINLFLGVDKKLAAANVEAFNVRTAAIAYENNTGKYPADSDMLLAGNYVDQLRAYYTIDTGNGRILDATMDNVGHIPTNPWTGIRWDFTSGSWVKQ